MVKNKGTLSLPKKYSIQLAEETGIHIGDGSLGCYKSVGKVQWLYGIHLHAIEDKKYSEFVKRLVFKLYNLSPYEKIQGKCVSLIYTRKELVKFKQSLGLPLGKKRNIVIPSWVFSKHSFLKSCVRGIVDTDGGIRFRKPFRSNIHKYPEIKISTISEELAIQLHDVFIDFGLSPNIGFEFKSENSKVYYVNLNGVSNVEKYISIFGFSNPKHQNKYSFWKRYGYYTKNDMKSGGAEI
ncbi:hypothetical protein CL619_04840 [archaeon]|nr:hypothetical protein [archaeon]|tara:strand:+ start:4615 stop:5328 length:714 start_codon:yes stop_codon:yes gene_type:complete